MQHYYMSHWGKSKRVVRRLSEEENREDCHPSKTQAIRKEKKRKKKEGTEAILNSLKNAALVQRKTVLRSPNMKKRGEWDGEKKKGNLKKTGTREVETVTGMGFLPGGRKLELSTKTEIGEGNRFSIDKHGSHSGEGTLQK